MKKAKLGTALLLVCSALIGVTGLCAYKAPVVEHTAPQEKDAGRPPEGAVPARTEHPGDPLPEGALARLGAPRFRHEGGRVTLVFGRDGKTLIGHTSSGVVIWDTATGIKQRRLPVGMNHVQRPPCIDVSPDGTTLAVGDYFRNGLYLPKISLWDLRSGKNSRTLLLKDEGQGDFSHLCFAPDGKSLALSLLGLLPGKALVFDLASGEVRLALGGKESYYNLVVSPDSKTLAVAVRADADPSHPHSVQLRDMATGDLIRTIFELPAADLKNQVFALTFAPDGKMLAFVSMNRIFLFDPATGQNLGELEEKKGHPRALAFSPDSTKLVSSYLTFGEAHGQAFIWDVATRKIVHTLDGPGSWSIAFAPDGKTIALAAGSIVQLWDVATGKRLITEHQGHESQISSLAYAPDGKTLISAGGQILLWDTAGWKMSGMLPGNAHILSFSADGKKLAMVADDEQTDEHPSVPVRIWDVTAGKEPLVITVPDATSVLAANLSRDGRKLFTLDNLSAAKNRVRRWDLATGKQDQLWVLPLPPSRLTLAADGKTVFATDRSVITAYDVESDRKRLVRSLENFGTVHLTVSPDARVLATGASVTSLRNGQNTSIRLCEVVSGKETFVLKGHPVTVAGREGDRSVLAAMAWSPDGRLLASGDRRTLPNEPIETQTVRLWDTANGKELAKFGGFKADVTTLAFAPDGTQLAAGLLDGTILILDVSQTNPRLLPALKLSMAELESRWTDLGGDNAGTAHTAIWSVVAAPKQSVPFLKGRLQPVAVVDAGKIHQWIADLDRDQFAVRQAAAKELLLVGEQVQPFLHKALKGNLSLEKRRRLEQIANALDVPAPATLRTIRAIMVLEKVGSAEARDVLEALSRGAPGARETEEARASLQEQDGR